MDSCPSGQIVGAVLGTFFGTLLLCVVLIAACVIIYRRRMAQLQVEMARRQTVSDNPEKKPVAPSVATQAYTNAGFLEHESYESQGTLQVRQPEVVQSSAMPIERSVDENPLRTHDGVEVLQDSVLQLTLAKQDGIGLGFEVRGGSGDGVSGGIYVAQVLPEASTLLRTVMMEGDEILSVNIEITRDLSVSVVREILRHALDCPVRLTLRGRRRPSSSNPIIHGINSDVALRQPTSSVKIEHGVVAVRPGSSSRRSSSDGSGSVELTERRSSKVSAGLTRWRSQPMSAAGQRPEHDADDIEIDGSHEEVFQTYPTYHGLTVETLPDRAQSLTNVKVSDDAARGPKAASLSPVVRTTASDDKLYVKVDVVHADDIASSSEFYAKSYSMDGDSVGSPDYVNVIEEETVRQGDDLERHLPDSCESIVDFESYVKVDRSDFDDDDSDSLQRALDAGRRKPNRTGLDKALRAKERESRGGMAYYVDLEPHFNDGTTAAAATNS